MSRDKLTLLVVEDERDILNLLAYTLENAGYSVLKAETGSDGLAKARSSLPDMVLLDLMLPDLDGFEVCRKLRQDSRTGEIPVVMLTARSDDGDVVTGLEAGADDYITKPFSPKVLEARIRRLLRKKAVPSEPVMPERREIHGIAIDAARHEVRLAGSEILLSATEFAILHFLITHPGWVFSRDQIIDAVKGGNYPVTERSVDVQILGIRRKLGEAGRYVETVRGVGYRMKGE